ncbi:MAG: hypothetical protein Q7U79_17000 [Rhodoferax sp.]|nr:hypothetical protein [Rhodoferax sp.]
MDFLGKGWVGSILGLFGIILAIWFYLKSIKTPKATVHIEASRMVGWGKAGDLPPGIAVSYQNVNVPRISRVLIRLWNSGSATLESNLIPSGEPFRIELSSKDSQILSGVLIHQTRQANNFSVKTSPRNPSVLLIDFNYVDPGEGALIGILHTDPESTPSFKGIVKGQRIAILDSNRQRNSFSKKLLKKSISKIRIFETVFLILGIAFLASAILLPNEIVALVLHFDSAQEPATRAVRDRFMFAGMGCSYIFLAALGLWSRRRRYPKNLEIPSENK